MEKNTENESDTIQIYHALFSFEFNFLFLARFECSRQCSRSSRGRCVADPGQEQKNAKAALNETK